MDTRSISPSESDPRAAPQAVPTTALTGMTTMGRNLVDQWALNAE